MSFTRVSKSHPCPVCKKPDWCRVFGDGWVECMRVQSDRPAKSGGWMWRLRAESTPHPSPLPDRGGEGASRTGHLPETNLLKSNPAPNAP